MMRNLIGIMFAVLAFGVSACGGGESSANSNPAPAPTVTAVATEAPTTDPTVEPTPTEEPGPSETVTEVDGETYTCNEILSSNQPCGENFQHAFDTWGGNMQAFWDSKEVEALIAVEDPSLTDVALEGMTACLYAENGAMLDEFVQDVTEDGSMSGEAAAVYWYGAALNLCPDVRFPVDG